MYMLRIVFHGYDSVFHCHTCSFSVVLVSVLTCQCVHVTCEPGTKSCDLLNIYILVL